MEQILSSMQEIDPIYKNRFGMGFYWRKDRKTIKSAVQIIFRDTGFYLKKGEILYFMRMAEEAQKRYRCPYPCSQCNRSILLKTPSKQVDLAVNRNELESICDLLKGVLFHIELEEYLYNLSLN